MDKTALVEQQIQEGKLFVSALDKAGLEIKAAFWFFDERYPAWKLMVSSSSTQLDVKKDVLNAHRTLINVMQSLPDLAFVSSGNVTVISLDHLLIRNFAPLIKTGPGIVNLWFSNSLLGNIYVQGMLIYRMDVQV